MFAGATTVVVLLSSAPSSSARYFFSRGVILCFWLLSIDSVSAFRWSRAQVLFALHRRGRNLSYGARGRRRARSPSR